MFPIGSIIPHDTASLRGGVVHGLAPLGVRADAVVLEGDFPRLDALSVNLTGARFHRGLEFNRAAGGQQTLCFARTVDVAGNPILVMDAPVAFTLRADDVVFAVADAASGSGKVLVLERANNGKVDVAIKRADLEKTLLAAGEQAARAKGAEVKSVELVLQDESPRALAMRAIVTAKAMFFTTTVTISGVVELDDHLSARLRDLHCEGDGMIGKMAAGVLRPQFEKLEQRRFPLGQAVAGLALTDVTLTGGDELRIHARFGSVA
jgi:hypothetical protein